MKKLQIAALLCFAFVLMPGCHKKANQSGSTPGQTGPAIQEEVNTGQQKTVTIDARCRTDEPAGGVHISRSAADHVRWTTPAGATFRVTFKNETPCHKSNAAGSAAVARYVVNGGQFSDQCFALKDTPTKSYEYLIENLSSGNPVVCADPAVIVEN